MNSRLTRLLEVFKQIERNVFQIFRYPPRDLALAYTSDIQPTVTPKKFSVKDLVGDGFLFAVPKFRRTLEKRLNRQFGYPDKVWKILVPKTNILVCHQCGHHHEHNRLCENCYKRVEEETKLIKEKIVQKLATEPVDKEVIVLYEGENLPEKAAHMKNPPDVPPESREQARNVEQVIKKHDQLKHLACDEFIFIPLHRPKEFWKGKRIVEMKKERPKWFSKNLLEKSTQAPSSATDVKPTDLA